MSEQAKHTPRPWTATYIYFRCELTEEERKSWHVVNKDWDMSIPITCPEGTPGEKQAKKDAHLIAASPELLSELEAAHIIIRNALNVMTTEEKIEWARRNERDGVTGEGDTRAHEREAAIARALGQ